MAPTPAESPRCATAVYLSGSVSNIQFPFFHFPDHLSLTVYQIEKTNHVAWICQQQLHPVFRTSQMGAYVESMKRGKCRFGVKLSSFPIYL